MGGAGGCPRQTDRSHSRGGLNVWSSSRGVNAAGTLIVRTMSAARAAVGRSSGMKRGTVVVDWSCGRDSGRRPRFFGGRGAGPVPAGRPLGRHELGRIVRRGDGDHSRCGVGDARNLSSSHVDNAEYSSVAGSGRSGSCAVRAPKADHGAHSVTCDDVVQCTSPHAERSGACRDGAPALCAVRQPRGRHRGPSFGGQRPRLRRPLGPFRHPPRRLV